jgi:hypothetical protein
MLPIDQRGAGARNGNFATVMLVTAVTAGMTCYAAAVSSSIGMTITSDREPNDFRDPKNTKYELNGGYTFDSGLILGGSFQFSDTAFSNRFPAFL